LKHIGIILPVFQEAEVIQLFHQELIANIQSIQNYEFKIVYVVDPSNDCTEKILADISNNDPRTEVLILSRRFGHQASLLAGIDNCDTDLIIMLDSDMQHPPQLIQEMVKIYEEKNVDIVQAVRTDGKEIGFFKKFTSRFFYKIINWFSDIKLVQGAADYRLISRQVADVIRNDIREQNQFLRGLFSWLGFDVAYIPFECKKRIGGSSKYKFRIMFDFAKGGFFSFSKLPLRISIYMGFFVVIVSLVIWVTEIVRYFLYPQEQAGWLTIFSLVIFFSGIQLVIIGILGEYIGLIFDEVKKRPNYIIHRKYKSLE